MSLITTAEAKLHLRVDGTDEDSLIELLIEAAEISATEYLDRNLYADSTALSIAVAAAPAALTSATATYEAAALAALELTSDTEQDLAADMAMKAYLQAQEAYRRAMNGLVLNAPIKSAMLLHIGSLYANRENEVMNGSELPLGVRWMLNPFRAYS